MAIAKAEPRSALTGIATPRIAPPVPAKSLLGEYTAAATELGLELMPWQTNAARYMTAINPKGKWLYRRVAIIVARQNGKTELLRPRILLGLRLGRRMLHTAQDRERPRETFEAMADWFQDQPARKALYGVRTIRRANGQETIRCTNGARYTLVAPRGGARGGSVDDVFLDEIREYHSFRIDGIIRPTMTARHNPQIIYMSNAGDSESVVLNDLRRRLDSPSLAYLEWSAAPDRPNDDRDGWAEANPALGLTIDLETLEDNFDSMEPPVWETEHLCRWVISMQPRLVSDPIWQRAHSKIEDPLRPVMGISMDVTGTRASAALAWQQSDGTLALTVLRDVTGDPIDTDRFGPDLQQLAMRLGVTAVAYDSWTDSDLARHLPSAKPLIAREYANASENFVRVLESGRLHWDEAEQISDDLTWTARKPHESGAWMAVKANDEHPITACLAAVRAVWLASAPKLSAPQVF